MSEDALPIRDLVDGEWVQVGEATPVDAATWAEASVEGGSPDQFDGEDPAAVPDQGEATQKQNAVDALRSRLKVKKDPAAAQAEVAPSGEDPAVPEEDPIGKEIAALSDEALAVLEARFHGIWEKEIEAVKTKEIAERVLPKVVRVKKDKALPLEIIKTLRFTDDAYIYELDETKPGIFTLRPIAKG